MLLSIFPQPLGLVFWFWAAAKGDGMGLRAELYRETAEHRRIRSGALDWLRLVDFVECKRTPFFVFCQPLFCCSVTVLKWSASELCGGGIGESKPVVGGGVRFQGQGQSQNLAPSGGQGLLGSLLGRGWGQGNQILWPKP